MKPTIKKRWLKALRSGEYKQARETLMDHRPPSKGGRSFCCLGVLCDLHSQLSSSPDWKIGPDGYEYCGDASELPNKVANWAGLELNGDPNIKITMKDARELDLPEELKSEVMKLKGSNRSLINLNDHWECSFEQIANLIERRL